MISIRPDCPELRAGGYDHGVKPLAHGTGRLPDWAEWNPSTPYSVGIEEEVILLEPGSWALARETDDMLADLPEALAPQVQGETHQGAAELTTEPHRTVGAAGREVAELRHALAEHLARHHLRPAGAGTHPTAVWTDVQVSGADRYQAIYTSMGQLAHREPTFALHVHIGVDDPERAVQLANRLRAHVPLLLALSGNSPYWQGRDSGLASIRIPIFQAFPRVGIPRAFASYDDYVGTVEQLIRCGAIPEPTFLWWDVRLQPGFGTVEMRIMDSQITADATTALAALTQTIAHLELEEGYHGDRLVQAAEVLDENRFLAARDGMQANLIDIEAGRCVPVYEQLGELLDRARPHAEALGCGEELAGIERVADCTGAMWQRRTADEGNLPALAERLADCFDAPS